MSNAEFHDLFGGPPRQPESRITRREMDLAASIQVVTEEALINIARHLRDLTGLANLCMAGGVALNCVANGKILREKVLRSNLDPAGSRRCRRRPGSSIAGCAWILQNTSAARQPEARPPERQLFRTLVHE